VVMTQPQQLQSDPIVGRRAGGGYVVVKRLGSGGMGDVYLAENPALGKRVALKVLHQHLTAYLGDRFLQEARAAVAINHPHVIDIIDLGTFAEDGRPYFLMSFLEGAELGDHVAHVGGQLGFGKRLPVDLALRLFAPVLDALAAAHEKGIVHRDLKPSNVFVRYTARGPHPTLLDFGIAKVLEESARVASKTQSAAVMGTPGYMAPEQARGAAVDARADIYSLGVMLYEVLTGWLPFSGETITDIAIQQVTTKPLNARQRVSDLPEAWDRTITQCLAVQPQDRPQTVREVALRLINATPDGYAIVQAVSPELVEKAGSMDPTVRAGGNSAAVPASASTAATARRKWPAVLVGCMVVLLAAAFALPWLGSIGTTAEPVDARSKRAPETPTAGTSSEPARALIDARVTADSASSPSSTQEPAAGDGDSRPDAADNSAAPAISPAQQLPKPRDQRPRKGASVRKEQSSKPAPVLPAPAPESQIQPAPKKKTNPNDLLLGR
jgi:serine/threonine protein kinase